MFSQVINCRFVEVTPNQSNDQRTQVDKLDITSVEKEGREEYTRRSLHRKSRREKIYATRETRTRRRDCFRRNKIAPTAMPTAEEGPSGEGTSGTQRGQHGIVNKPIEASDDHVVIGFCETPDSFSQRKNSALALQSFATCARLNANFLRKAAWTPKQEASDSDASDNEKAITRSASFSSKISSAWKVLRGKISHRGSYVSAQGEASTSGGSTSEAQETTDDPTDSRNSQRKLKKENSCKKTNSKPFHGIQELGGDDSTFDRDLYMQINNLAITHDTSQFPLRDPFLVQEHIPALAHYQPPKNQVKIDHICLLFIFLSRYLQFRRKPYLFGKVMK